MVGGWKRVDDKTVLAYLKSKRAALDQAIAALEGKAGDAPEALGGGDSSEEIQPDSFVGMNIATASVKYLKMVGRPARTTEQIYEALSNGGLAHFTRESVATILYRIHNQGGDIFRVSKGLWGLSEWYPNRPKPAKKKSQEDIGGKKSVTEKKKQKQPKSRQGKETNRPRTMTRAKAGDFNATAAEWLGMLRDAGKDGLSTAKLAAGLGYDSGRPLPFIAIRINKMLSGAKIDPKTVYEGRRVEGKQRWFAREKIEEALKLMKA